MEYSWQDNHLDAEHESRWWSESRTTYSDWEKSWTESLANKFNDVERVRFCDSSSSSSSNSSRSGNNRSSASTDKVDQNNNTD